MEMKNILNLGERLKALIEKAESESETLISQAQKKSEKTIAEAKEAAEKRLFNAQRRTGLDEFLVEAEKEAEEKAEQVTKEYTKRVQDINNTSDEKIKKAVDYVLKEMLPK